MVSKCLHRCGSSASFQIKLNAKFRFSEFIWIRFDQSEFFVLLNGQNPFLQNDNKECIKKENTEIKHLIAVPRDLKVWVNVRERENPTRVTSKLAMSSSEVVCFHYPQPD